MKILVLANDVPATANMAGSPRLFSLCRPLARQHQLTLVTFTQSRERLEAYQADPTVAGVFDRIVQLPDPPASRWWGQQVHRLRQEAHFVTRYRTPEFFREQCARLRDLFVQGGFDMIFADGLWVAQYVEGAAIGCPAIIDLHDSMTMFIQRSREMEPSLRKRLALWLEEASIGRCERALRRTFGAVVVNSRVDAAFLRALTPETNTVTIGNGVDVDFFGADDRAGDLHQLVFTGVMSYAPNADAARYFGESIFPLIQAAEPKVTFWVVGKDPGDAVLALAQRPGTRVTGSVPDVRPYLHQAGIFVCPLRFGTGVKNKLLAALAMRKAVVATTLSLDGLDLRPDQDLLVADTPAEFAAQVIRLVRDPALARRLGESGQAFVREQYSWEGNARQLESTLLQVAGTAGFTPVAAGSPPS
jgi:glycosyltransferase involved in cell wall biosynthesis